MGSVLKRLQKQKTWRSLKAAFFFLSHGRDVSDAREQLIRQILREKFHLRYDSFSIHKDNLGAPSLLVRLQNGSEEQFSISISHSGRWLSVGMLPESQGKIGIDIEQVRNFSRSFLQAFLHPEEYRLFRALPFCEQRRRATILWSAKESYLKALGVGLHRHPKEIMIEVDTRNRRFFVVDEKIEERISGVFDWVPCGIVWATVLIPPYEQKSYGNK